MEKGKKIQFWENYITKGNFQMEKEMVMEKNIMKMVY